MDRTGRDARLALLAGRQAGAFSLRQAMGQGFPKATVYSRVSSGSWERRRPGVFVVGGSERSRLQDLWVAVLAVGSGGLLSHESSALIHGAERLDPDPIVLTIRHGWHQRQSGLFVHQIDDVLAGHATTWRGLPVSTAARSVVELGATQSEATVGRVADDLVRMRRTTFPRIAAVLAAVTRPGKPGIERVARVLEARGDGYVPPGSELERALFDALAAGGLPAPERQVRLPGRGPVQGIVDGAYRDARIVLEADGRRWHTRMAAARQDRERDAQVVRSGWVPLRWVYEQIVHHPDELCDVVSDTRAVRLRDLTQAA